MLLSHLRPQPKLAPRPKENFSMKAASFTDSQTGEKMIYQEFTVKALRAGAKFPKTRRRKNRSSGASSKTSVDAMAARLPRKPVPRLGNPPPPRAAGCSSIVAGSSYAVSQK